MHGTQIFFSSMAIFIAPTLSTICWGNNWEYSGLDPTKYNVAYIQGTVNYNSDVSPVIINKQGSSPCGVSFSIDDSGDHSGYTLNGCGGSSLWLDQYGAFHSPCTYEPQQLCPNCNNVYAGYFEQQYCC